MIGTEQAAAAFRAAYGGEPLLFAQAPGRINLIGEHVDYAQGCVLPVALSQGITVAAGEGRAGRIRVHSDQYLDAGVAEFDPVEAPPPEYLAFVHALALETKAAGADLAVVSDLPVERGWSSSAAFAVAVTSALIALDERFLKPSALDLVLLCQRAEGKALGVQCGLMDQYAAVFGHEGYALLLDTWKVTHTEVPIALAQAEFVVVDSGQPRQLSTSSYNQRRQELEQGLAELHDLAGAFDCWRELDRSQVKALLDQLTPPGQQRLRHVVTEQERVEHFVTALAAGDLIQLGRLLSLTHASLRDDYEVSTPELDTLVDALNAEAGIYGARLVGGGFGGGVLALAGAQAVPGRVISALAVYQARTKLQPAFTVAESGDGAMIWLKDQPPRLVKEWLQ